MNKIFLALGVTATLICNFSAMPVKATSNLDTQVFSVEDQSKTAGLIQKCSLNVSGSNRKLYINGSIVASSEMKSIGYKDISIEYSSNNVNWYEETNIGNLLKSNSNNYYLNGYTVSVNGGYYYRISCDYYAKESGLFGSSESISATSNSVWIS